MRLVVLAALVCCLGGCSAFRLSSFVVPRLSHTPGLIRFSRTAHPAPRTTTTTTRPRATQLRAIRVSAPLLEDGLIAREASSRTLKPLLLFIPGLDGTRLSPFLQLPKLGDRFTVRCLEVSPDDRSSFDDVVDAARKAVARETSYYVVGESFGALVALGLDNLVRAKGLVLVNPATSYRRSRLREVARSSTGGADARLGSLFFASDALGFLSQLVAIVSGGRLPVVVDSPEREAYMGRFAQSLPRKVRTALPDADTIAWRLDNWLEAGSRKVALPDADDRVLLVVGSRDDALPSMDEAFQDSSSLAVSVVDGASHGTTLAVRCDLADVMERFFFSGDKDADEPMEGRRRRIISNRGGLSTRPHPPVAPRDYEKYRAPPARLSVCLGDDCRKDGASDVLRALKRRARRATCVAAECSRLCGDGPIVSIRSGVLLDDAAGEGSRGLVAKTLPGGGGVRRVTKVDDIAKVEAILRDVGEDVPFSSSRDNTINREHTPASAETIVSTRRGPLDLDRTKRTVLQRAVWFAIICGVSAVEDARGEPLAMLPDRALVLLAFLASTQMVPEGNRELRSAASTAVRRWRR